MRTRPPIYTKYYDLLGWILDRVGKFPKNTRFGLVQKIESIAMNNLDLLIEALYRKDRHVLFEPVNIGLEKLRVDKGQAFNFVCDECRCGGVHLGDMHILFSVGAYLRDAPFKVAGASCSRLAVGWPCFAHGGL